MPRSSSGRAAKETTIYQLKVTLKNSRPPIWRRLQVPDDCTLYRLHLILQTAMGWSNEHLFSLQVAGREYGDPMVDEGGELGMANARRTRLDRLGLREKSAFVYEYDFGDGWEHAIVVEHLLPPTPGVHYPRCLAGRRACPPEDVGGIWGYQEFLDAIRDPEHEEHDDMLEWIGGTFDPEAFDLAAVNEALGGTTA